MSREQRAWDNLMAAFDREFGILLDVATTAARGGFDEPMNALLQRIESMVELYNECIDPPSSGRPVAQA